MESPLGPPASNGVKSSTADAPARITFFEKPTNWLLRQETLRAFRDDGEYRVHGGLANVATLKFTVAQLRELAPGTVLTSDGHSGQEVVFEAEFEEAAQDVCDGP